MGLEERLRDEVFKECQAPRVVPTSIMQGVVRRNQAAMLLSDDSVQYLKAGRPNIEAVWAAKGSISYSHPSDNDSILDLFFGSLPKELNISRTPWQEFQTVRIKKLLVNACLNPVTALLQVKNGGLLLSQHTKDLIRSITQEAFAVLREDQPEAVASLSAEGMYEEMLSKLVDMGPNISSMCADVRAGNEETEM